jgi:Flp pilus assembly secretin CpaC
MFIIGVFGTHATFAQVQPSPRLGSSAQTPAALPSGSAPVIESTEAKAVDLLVGRSALVDIGAPIARVSLTSADIADALVTGQSQLLVHGKTPGSISMFVWDRAGAVKRYEIAVQRDLARLNDQVRELFPGESIEARSNGKAVVLSGKVSSKEVADKAVAVAAGYVDKPTDVTTLLQVQPGPRSNQVLLRVRFAEVSRSAMSEYGMSLFTGPTGINNTIGRATTQQYPAPAYTDLAWQKAGSDFGSEVTKAEGKLAFSDFLNVFLLNQKYDLGVLIKALQNKGLFQSLAEPNLVAESGKEASFLAGGEFPVPIAQGSGANIGVSVQFKEFGIRLNFTPTVVGDRVHLKVRPEVSTLDYGNAVLLSGFRIPLAVDSPRRDRTRAAERSDVCHRRSDEQPDADDDAEDSWHRRHSDPRLHVQEQGVEARSDGTRRDDYAGDSAEQFAGRDAVASELPGYVHAAAVGSEEDLSRSGARVHRAVTVAGGESGSSARCGQPHRGRARTGSGTRNARRSEPGASPVRRCRGARSREPRRGAARRRAGASSAGNGAGRGAGNGAGNGSGERGFAAGRRRCRRIVERTSSAREGRTRTG